MNLKYTLIIFIIICLLAGYLGLAPVMAQAPGSNEIRVLSSTKSAILLELTVADFQIETVNQAGQSYQRIIIPGMVQTDFPGDPQVPTRGIFLGLPTVEGVSVRILETDYVAWEGVRLPPAPGLRVAGDNPRADQVEPAFILNQNRYSSDAFHPLRPVEIGFTGLMRDQAVAQVQFYPLQYNPVSGEVRLHRRILAQIIWDTPPSTPSRRARAANPAYETLLQQTLLNYDALIRSDGAENGVNLERTHLDSPLPAEAIPALKIGVTEDGLYEVTYGDLAAAGWNLNGVDPRTIQLRRRGLEVPIYLPGEADGIFDPTDMILFYGRAINDIYTGKNIYWLTAGQGNGRRMATRDGAPSGSAPVAAQFPVTHHAEKETQYWVTLPDGEGQDHWFWGNKFSVPEARNYTLTLNNIPTTAATTTVRLRLRGFTEVSNINPDHHTRLSLNGLEIDDQFWDGFGIFEHEVTLPHSYLNEGSNTLQVNGVGDTGAIVDQFFLNWIEIDYWDTYVAEEDSLLFGAPEAGAFRFEVTNFSENEVQVFDVTDPAEVIRLTNPTVVADNGGYKLQFEDSAQIETRYLALAAARLKSPAGIEVDQPSVWRSTTHGADYIIITHSDFYSSALRLAAHHAASGMRTATVKVEDLYDEFNDGVFNPQAIRDFLAYSYQNWVPPAPTYVLLLGGGSYDYRDRLNLKRATYIPIQIIETDLLGQTPSDNWFVLVSGDDVLPDMFIGRLTAQTPSEADDMVDKIIYYDQNPPPETWNKKVLLVADDNAPTFETISEILADRLPHYYTATKVYVDAYPPGDPTLDIAAAINGGSLLVNYTGHGNVDRWGSWSGGDTFGRSDVDALQNTNKLPFVTVANCLNGNFAGDRVSMAEAFLSRPGRGAVGVWAATSLGYPSGHRVLIHEFYKAIFQYDQYALGTATTQAKLATYAQSSFWGELVETFVLLGDPAAELGLPTNYPYLTATGPGDGATGVPVDQPLQLTFSKPMDPASVALSGEGSGGITFSPTWNADRTLLHYAHSDFPYSRPLTFTLQGRDGLGNALGPGLVPASWSLTTLVPTPIESVAIAGPTMGVAQTNYTFTATGGPITATQPITYRWEATGHPPLTRLGDLDDALTLAWETPGLKTITLTATNAAGVVTDTHAITVEHAPPGAMHTAGPARGVVQVAYPFTATVEPVATTLPLTYHWRATDHRPLTRSEGGLSDSLTFTWETPGSKAITITAANAGGGVTRTHHLTIDYARPAGLALNGPAQAAIATPYRFKATVAPVTATRPITYRWRATDQLPQTHPGSGLNDAITFTWQSPGAQTITVTATNAGGAITKTHQVALFPVAVEIRGPTRGLPKTTYPFVAVVSPITASRPLTYHWQAGGNPPVTHSGDLSDTTTFRWDTAGAKAITLTTSNAEGRITATHRITINISPAEVAISGPARGIVATPYLFKAALMPVTATQPITYRWQTTDQSPVTHPHGGQDDEIAIAWSRPGPHVISVTATNIAGAVTASHTITLSAPPTDLVITGPTTGTVDAPYSFIARVGPITASVPITYLWQANGQAAVTNLDGLSNTVTFSWRTPGTQLIVVTAMNNAGSADGTYLFTANPLPPDPDSALSTTYLPLILKDD